MARIKIKSMYFQRNGVHGAPFYHALISYREGGVKPIDNMLVSFQSHGEDYEVSRETFRAVDLDNIQEAWRGDVIAYDLETHLKIQMKANGGTIYDCCTKKVYAV